MSYHVERVFQSTHGLEHRCLRSSRY
jgi:hypothetical protein